MAQLILTPNPIRRGDMLTIIVEPAAPGKYTVELNPIAGAEPTPFEPRDNRYVATVNTSGMVPNDYRIIARIRGKDAAEADVDERAEGTLKVNPALDENNDVRKPVERPFVRHDADERRDADERLSRFRPGDTISVTLQRTQVAATNDLALWVVIRKSTEALSFDNYRRFMNLVLCGVEGETVERRAQGTKEFDHLRQQRFLPYNDADAYRLLKVATEAFVVVNCGVSGALPFTGPDKADLDKYWGEYLAKVNGMTDPIIPYLARIRENLSESPIKQRIFVAQGETMHFPEECYGILRDKLLDPCMLELIWSYWHEEGMLAQTMSVIGRRFQNIRGPGDRDPLAGLELDPLRPLNNLLWSYIQDEQHRLTVVRRAYEYDHHYGISLVGKAVPNLRPADSRSKFLEAFHNLLYLCTEFFRQDDDTTVVADGFTVLNGLKEVHLLLSEGAHNQFGDLPSTARQEMLLQQWLLARPEFREFLPTRVMVDYPETWMHRVEAMKTLQGWTDTSIIHFNTLARFGEQILLSIRFGAWSRIDDAANGANWARYWRSEIRGYIHAYRAVTGIDLAADMTDSQNESERYLPPAVHLQRRLGSQRQKGLPAPSGGAIARPQRALRGNGRK